MRVQLFDGTLPLRLLADGEEWRQLHRVAEHPPSEQEHRRAWLDGAHRRRLTFGSGPNDEDVVFVPGPEAALTLPGDWIFRGGKFQQQSRLCADQLSPRQTPNSFDRGNQSPVCGRRGAGGRVGDNAD
jgi:hypothetical protein